MLCVYFTKELSTIPLTLTLDTTLPTGMPCFIVCYIYILKDILRTSAPFNRGDIKIHPAAANHSLTPIEGMLVYVT